MRTPAFLASWLLVFALAASALALGGALLLERDLRRERAGAAAESEMEAFLDGKLSRQAQGPGAPAVIRGLAGVAPSHEGGIGAATAEVARFRAPSQADRPFLYRREGAVSGSEIAWPTDLHRFRDDLVRYRTTRDEEMIAAVHKFPNGDELLVGRRVERVDPLSGRVLRISGLTVLALGLAGGAVAWAFAVQYNRRLRAITDACERVEAGEMAARAPDADRRDEFGALSQRVNRMLDRVSRYVQGMRDVSDEIAHDLRTPLNRAQSRLAALEPRVDPEGRKDLDLASEDLRNLSRSVDDFLWLREVEAGHGGETGFFDLTALCRQVAEDHALIAEDQKAIRLTVTGDPVEAMGVHSLLVRAIDNLIGNAVKFTPPGGEIRVAIERAERAVRVIVEDTGPGMPADLLAKAIQPGVRGAHDAPGHGLGLTIAASVARRHGGDLELTNLTKRGLRAALTLPAQPAPLA
jgi:signal transduction histidine kinase